MGDFMTVQHKCPLSEGVLNKSLDPRKTRTKRSEVAVNESNIYLTDVSSTLLGRALFFFPTISPVPRPPRPPPRSFSVSLLLDSSNVRISVAVF